MSQRVPNPNVTASHWHKLCCQDALAFSGGCGHVALTRTDPPECKSPEFHGPEDYNELNDKRAAWQESDTRYCTCGVGKLNNVEISSRSRQLDLLGHAQRKPGTEQGLEQYSLDYEYRRSLFVWRVSCIRRGNTEESKGIFGPA